MMNLHLNLISPAKKKRFFTLAHFLFIKEILELIIFTAALLAVIYLVGWLVLTRTLNDLAQSSLVVNREIPAVNREIRKLNLLVGEIARSGENFSPLSPLLLELAKTLPADIRLTGLTLDKTNGSFIISGMAKTRADLLAYQETIGKLSWLEGTSAPTSQLFQKENINFEIRGRLKDYQPPTRVTPPQPAETE